MTEYDIHRKLQNRFFSLNDFSGIEFLNSRNVCAGENTAFCIPESRRWFSLHFMADAPDSIGLGNNSQERITGVFQIDIYVPLDKGENEAESKYIWIKKLFRKGSEIDEITINSVYKATAMAEKDSYKSVVRVEWTADITF